MKMFRAAIAAAVVLCASAAVADPIADLLARPDAAVTAWPAVVPPAPQPAPTAVTFDAATLTAVAQFLVALIGGIGGLVIQRTVRDTKKRAALEALWDNAVGIGYTMTPGAIKGRTLTVDLGSQVAANGLKWAMRRGKDALGKLEPHEAAEQILARIPAIDGDVSADVAHRIAAAAQGHPPPLDPFAAAQALGLDALAEKLLPTLVDRLAMAAAAANGNAAIASGRQDSPAA